MWLISKLTHLDLSLFWVCSYLMIRWTTKMVPQMAATVLCSSVFVQFLFVFPVFCFSNTISFTRDELLNIRQNTPQNLLPDFDYSDVLLDIVVGGAVALVKRFRTRRRGKRAGALVKLCQHGFRTSLPSIHLANLRSTQQNGQTSSTLPDKQGFFKLCCSAAQLYRNSLIRSQTQNKNTQTLF